MKPKSKNLRYLLLGTVAVVFTFLLASWGFHQEGIENKNGIPQKDTLPKARNLDQAIAELERLDIQKEMASAMKEVEKAMKEFDATKVKLEIENAMKEIDMSKIRSEIDAAMKEVDFAKIEREIKAALDEVDMQEIKSTVQQSLNAIDWKEIESEIKRVQDIDMKGLEKEMNRAAEEMKNLGPQMEKELQKAKAELDKAKETLKEYKTFVDGLENDGLISKKAGYTIRHKEGKLIINGKEADQKVYNKYKPFLDKHPSVNIRQSDDDFNVDLD